MYRVSNRDGEFYYCAPDKCARGNRVLIPLAYMDTAVNDAVMAMADMPHLVIKTMPADDHSNEIAQIKQDISELDPEATTYDYDAELAKRRAEIARLRELDRNEAKPLKRDINPDGKTVGEIWESLDTAGRRQWLLARNGRVQVSARDRELGVWITDIDLGEYTDAAYSLATLKA